jgi:bifunctional DNA-binding transcriptional regulator/antitoxin component of YhaV-PrlF toxin-antitoxin module
MIVEVQEKDGELYIEFPEDLLKELDWNEGDVLVWTDNGNGSYTISKKEANE